MEFVIAIVVLVAVGALIYFNRSARSLDINQDGRVDAADAAAAVQNVTEGVQHTVTAVAESVKTVAKSPGMAAKKSNTRTTAAKKPRRSRKTSA